MEIKESIKEFGYVHRVQKSDQDDYEMFIQNNYYYICDVEETKVKQELDDYEEWNVYTKYSRCLLGMLVLVNQ